MATLFLGSYNNSFDGLSEVPYLMEVSTEGEFIWDTFQYETEMSAYSQPVGDLIVAGDETFYFFALEGTTEDIGEIPDDSTNVVL